MSEQNNTSSTDRRLEFTGKAKHYPIDPRFSIEAIMAGIAQEKQDALQELRRLRELVGRQSLKGAEQQLQETPVDEHIDVPGPRAAESVVPQDDLPLVDCQ